MADPDYDPDHPLLLQPHSPPCRPTLHSKIISGSIAVRYFTVAGSTQRARDVYRLRSWCDRAHRRPHVDRRCRPAHQGFLAKIALTRSYLCLNAYSVALFPSHAEQGEAVLPDPAHLAWRNSLFDLARTPKLQAVIAFGAQAQKAIALWPGKSLLPVIKIPHPSSHDETVLVTKWRQAITQLRGIVTPDPDGDTSLPNYGNQFLESDYRPIPRRDLPFGAPPFLGDNSAGRAATPRRPSSVKRPIPDDRHTLIWVAPKS